MSTKSSPDMSAAVPAPPSTPIAPSVLKASAAEFIPSPTASARAHSAPQTPTSYTVLPQQPKGLQYDDQQQYAPFSSPDARYYPMFSQPKPGYQFPSEPVYYNYAPPVYHRQSPSAPWHPPQNGYTPVPNGYTTAAHNGFMPQAHNGYGNFVNPYDPFANQMRQLHDTCNGTVNNTFNNNMYGGGAFFKKKGKNAKKNRKHRKEQTVLENGDGKVEGQVNGQTTSMNGFEHNGDVNDEDEAECNAVEDTEHDGVDKAEEAEK
jgi:hypothetical protein